MLDLPRSARLAAWSADVLDIPDGQAPDARALRDAVAAVTGDDEPHAVAWSEHARSGAASTPPSAHEFPLPGLLDGAGLGDLFLALRRARVRGLRVVLPAPGDPTGLPGPAHFNTEALDVGECLVTVGPPDVPTIGFVPEVTEFGSQWEPGALVVWRAYPVVARRVALRDLAGADRELRQAMIAATDELHGLDVARWRPGAAEGIQAVRAVGVDHRDVPAALSPRALRTLTTAARLRAVVVLARDDDGAAVTGWEADRRARALSDVDRVARAALEAAVNTRVEGL